VNNKLPLRDTFSEANISHYFSVSIWNLSTGNSLGSVDVSSFCARSICGGAAPSPSCSLDTIVFAYATCKCDLHSDIVAASLVLNAGAGSADNEPLLHRFDSRANAVVPVSAPARAFDVASNYCTSHQQAISALEFSHDGELLASSSWDSTCMLWKVTTVAESNRAMHAEGDARQEVCLTLLMVLPVHEEGASCLAFTVDDQTLVTCGECVVKLWDLSHVSTDNQKTLDRPAKSSSRGAQRLEWQQAIPFSFSIASSTNLWAFDESLPALASNHEWCHVRTPGETLSLLTPAQSEEERNEAIDVKQCLDQLIEEIDPKPDEMQTLLGAIPGRPADKSADPKSENNSTRELLDTEKDPHALTAEESARLKAQFRTMEDFDFERLFTPALSLSLAAGGPLDAIPARTVTREPLLPDANGRLVRTFSKKTAVGFGAWNRFTRSATELVTDDSLCMDVVLCRMASFRPTRQPSPVVLWHKSSAWS
jgi:hypothetical protein